MEVTVDPITEPDIGAVADFLHFNLNRRMSPDEWTRSIRAPWKSAAPNYGYLLRAGSTVVGAYVAFYSERLVNDRQERFCNLGPWCVQPAYRFHSLRLLKALLAQPDYHFTDLSAGAAVIALNRRLKFDHLDTTTAFTPHLPWPSQPGRRRVSCDPAVVERTLSGDDLALYQDHATANAARHLVLLDGDDYCYVIYRKDRRKDLRRLVFFVTILYVSNPALFQRMSRPLSRHLLLHHAALGRLVELRVAGHRPAMSRIRTDFRPKMYRSPYLQPEDIDNLYSELTCVPW